MKPYGARHLVNISSGDDLSHVKRQTITWTNAD